MMKLLTKATALFLCVFVMLVTALPARGANDSYEGRTLSFFMYCETEDAIRTLVGYLVAGDKNAADKFYMAESTPCYRLPQRVDATVIRVVARVPFPKNAVTVALVLEVRVRSKAGFVVYVFTVERGSVPKDTKDPGGTPALQGDQRDI